MLRARCCNVLGCCGLPLQPLSMSWSPLCSTFIVFRSSLATGICAPECSWNMEIVFKKTMPGCGSEHIVWRVTSSCWDPQWKSKEKPCLPTFVPTCFEDDYCFRRGHQTVWVPLHFLTNFGPLTNVKEISIYFEEMINFKREISKNITVHGLWFPPRRSSIIFSVMVPFVGGPRVGSVGF